MAAASVLEERARELPRSDSVAARLEREVHCVLGLPFDAVDLARADAIVRDAIASRRRCLLSTPNLNFAIGCRGDRAFRDSVLASDLCIADGMPVVWIARLLGVPLRERVAGSDLFERLRRGASSRLSVYFFGGMPGVAEEACRRLNAHGGGLSCAGWESPGFGSVAQLSRDDSVARINASGADFLVVSLGARKGQEWIEHNRERISVPLISHLGAVLNFAAGSVKRAPASLQGAGLEWLWRVKEERFLWRRYLSDGVALLRLLLTHVLPFAWMLRRHRPAYRELADARLDSRSGIDGVSIRLRGPWTQANLAPLRKALARALSAWCHVDVYLDRAAFVDTACLGLLMLAYGTQKRRRLRLVCRVGNPRLRRLFELAGAEYLLEDAPRSSSAEMAFAADEFDLADVAER